MEVHIGDNPDSEQAARQINIVEVLDELKIQQGGSCAYIRTILTSDQTQK